MKSSNVKKSSSGIRLFLLFLVMVVLATKCPAQSSQYFQWPQYQPAIAYDYQDEFGTLNPPTKVLNDVSGVAGTYTDGWWCFRWGANKNPAVTEADWIPMLERLNEDFAYITDIMRWPRDLRARNGYYSAVYLYGSGLSTDNASNTDTGGWMGSVYYNGQNWPMILASYYPVNCFDPSYTNSDKGYQTGAMVHEGIHCILASMPGCTRSCWFHEGGNTWLQGTMEAQRSGNFSGLGWLSVGAAIAPFMPIECYSGWLQDGSFGGPCAEGVNRFEDNQQICTWRNLLGGAQYGECFPHALEVILGPKSIAWIWRNCHYSGRVLQDLAEAPGGLGAAQTRRLIQEYRARQAFCDFGPWSYAFRQLLNNSWNASIEPEWQPYWINCPTWNATCYVNTSQSDNVLIPEERTLPGWSGANQIPLTIDPAAAQASVTFNPIGANMSCQLVYRDTGGSIHYGVPVSSGACSIPLANVMNNVIIAVICNTDYIYNGESTRTAKFDYTLSLDEGITQKANIYTRWYNYSPSSYTITASADINGAIIPAGPVSVNAGGSQTFTFNPDPGFEVDQVLLNGLPIGTLDSYTFNNVRGNYTISVTFKGKQQVSIRFQGDLPDYGSEDIYFLNESTADTGNVNEGNDAATVISQDNNSLGQTFTTGPDPQGYLLSGLWLRHVNYAPTEWDINNRGARLQIRLLSVQGSSLSEILVSNYTVTGDEPGNTLMADPATNNTGTGTWIHFDLGQVIALPPDTQYAFDITVPSSGPNFSFETAGVNSNGYPGGSAYRTSAKSALSLGSVYAGDHTFIADMIDRTAVETADVQYDFEGDTFDSSGNNFHATPNGAPAYSAGYLGDHAIDLDGADDYLSIPGDTVNHEDITIATWIRWDGGSNWQRIFDFGSSTSKYMYLTPSTSNKTMRFTIRTTSGGEQTLESSRLAVGQWTHVAVTLAGDTGTLYVNGLEAATSDNITLNPTDLNPTENFIGKSRWSDPYFHGLFDDFRIYHHALPKPDIMALVTIGRELNSPVFLSNPVNATDATQDSAYLDSIADSATDPQNDPLTYRKVSGPDWLIVAGNGELSGTPANSDTGSNTFTIRVSDSNDNSDEAALIINVINVNDPPAWNTQSIIITDALENTLYSGSISGEASDIDAGDTLTFSKINGPDWLTVDSNGALSGIPTATDVGENIFTLRVSDSNGDYDDAMLSITVHSLSMIAHYTFDNNPNDSIGTNHGTITGAVTYPAGRIDQAIDLDGSQDYVTLPAGLFNMEDITVTAWVNWDGGGYWQRIFDFGNNTSQYMFLTPRSGGGTLRFAVTTSGNGAEQMLETAILPTGQWVHIAVTLQGNVGKLYVNGTQRDSDNNISINPSDFNPANNFIGDSQWPGDPLFNGRIDDFRIYNYALSATQIAAIAAGNTAPSFITDPIGNLNGIELSSYTGAPLSTYATDADGMATVTFSKMSGPNWLTIAGNGSLSGTPQNTNVGLNAFKIRVQDPEGLFDTAQMTIQVANIYSGSQGMEDLLGLVSQWMTTGCMDNPRCQGADLNGNSAVDMTDFFILAGNWLKNDN